MTLHPNSTRPTEAWTRTELRAEIRLQNEKGVTMDVLEKLDATWSIYRRGIGDISLKDRKVVDFGCGEIHPYNISALFFLNGARECFAVDIRNVINRESALQALSMLIQNCIENPQRWQWGRTDNCEFMRRAIEFDLEAAPIVHHVGSIESFIETPKSIDLIVSSTVIEHVDNLELISRHFRNIMSPTGVCYHNVDYSDHSVHADSSKNYWSFMLQGDRNRILDIKDGGDINKLRNSQVEKIFRDAGFHVKRDDTLRLKPPNDVMMSLLDEYRDMSVDDLELVSAGLRLTCST